MHRDMDLIRNILMKVADNPSAWAPDNLSIAGYTDEQIGYHALLLLESGLADGFDTTVQGGEPQGMISRLTWEGHDFLEAAKEQSRWDEAKQLIFERAGSASLQVWKAILLQLTKTSLGL